MHVNRCAAARALMLALVAAAWLAVTVGSASAAGSSWPSGGHDGSSSRWASDDPTITAAKAPALAKKWTFTTHGDVSATAAVVDGSVYVPDWGGWFYKLNANTGAVVWAHQISEYDGVSGAVSRTSPAVVGNTVYIGDQNGAHLLAINTATGALRWSTQLDPHFAAVLTASPVVVGGVVYEGVSSLEESLAAFIPGYPCCSFRGSMTAVNAKTGQLLWKTYTVPLGYSGGAVWSTTAAVDPSSHTVYIDTGNNYSIPDSAEQCQAAGGTPQQCLSPDNHIDSIMALSTDTGAIRWATGEGGFDDWNVACIPGIGIPDNCPPIAGPDADFGSNVNLFTALDHGSPRLAVGAGQKSGQYWALDAADGHVIWSASPGPGSTLGGIEWGTATDGKQIFADEANADGLSYQLPNGQTTTAGSIVALNAQTGAVNWQIADPDGSVNLAPVSLGNGVLYASSMSGRMYAIDTRNGNLLWSYLGQGSSNAGPAIAEGTVFWGNGYAHLGIPGFTGSTTFYAFSYKGS
jgi:polyvinyl alcohol dehydrogenase (cytochrome)